MFESCFDSFEFDDGFLMKIDSSIKKNKINEKIVQTSSKTADKLSNVIIEKKMLDKKGEYYDSPLFIEDINESDFFDNNKKEEIKHSSEVFGNHTIEKSKSSVIVNLTSCLSPIHGVKSGNKVNLSTSTPVKPNDISSAKKLNSEEKVAKHCDYDYLEADLFDDWGLDGGIKENSQKSTVTLSQAIKMIEEAESVKNPDPKESLNQSIDLLTGEAFGADIGIMFEESFGLSKTADKEIKIFDSSDNSVVVLENCKPSAAQKLNFESEKVGSFKLATDKDNNCKTICFNSDDDFDFLTQDLLEKPKQMSKTTNLCFTKVDETSLKNCDLDESTEDILNFKKKRGKHFKIMSESDTGGDSPSPKFRRQNNKKKKNSTENLMGDFIEFEAEVSDEVEVSSDEEVEEGDYDKSFVDEESYLTQNNSTNMMTTYLESVKTVNFPGRFKIPAAKPYNPYNVFSQIPEESNADYEIDSFCVNDVEEERKTELSDLEIAEKILEMNRKKKKKRSQKLKLKERNKI